MTTQLMERDTERIDHEAREWLVYLYSDEASEDGRSAFSGWLSASPDHVSAFRTLEQAYRDLALVDSIHPFEAPRKRHRRAIGGPLRRFTLAVSGVFAACLTLGLYFGGAGLFTPKRLEVIEFASPVGAVNQFRLPDGSVVTLDSGSKIEVAFSDRARRVELIKGRAFFDVEPDPNRLFTVDSEFGRVSVTGTMFDVWREAAFDFVGVTEGQVQISPLSESSASAVEPALATLGASESLSILPDGTVSTTTAYDPERSQQWREGRLVFIDESLGVILAAVNRYRDEPIEVVDDEILDLRVTIAVKTDALDDFYTGIETILPVSVSHMGSFTYLYADD